MPHPATLVDAFRSTVENHPDRIALRSYDDDRTWTWAEASDVVDALAGGMARLGVRRGDTVAILLPNQPEWQLADLAALVAGGIPFSLFLSAPVDQQVDLLERARAAVVVTDAATAARLREHGVPEGLAFITVDSDDRAASFADLCAEGVAPPEVEIGPNDVATLIYTSGTTGPPKGVELSHRAILFMTSAIGEATSMTDLQTLSYLPHAHIVDRIVGHYLPLVHGGTVTTLGSVASLLDALPTVRPTFFTSVPRLWQRIQAHLQTLISTPGDWADKDAASLRERVGLDRAPWLITGSAPLPHATHEFFASIDMPLHDLWGLSETTAIATWSLPGDHHIGTVGRPLPDTEIRIADDGEVLVRGPHLANGYRDDPAATAEAFVGRWFHTGDLGQWVEGRLEITGRKKELIVSAGGENMSPSRIENVIASSSSAITSVMVVGDARPFNVALVVVDPAAVPAGTDVEQHVNTAIASANQRLSRAEQIRRHAVLKHAWSPEGGEMTPTLKLRRGPVATKYANLVSALYAEGSVPS